ALPDAPMPSNFTARVLAEVEREEKLQARAGGSSWRFWNWRFRWLPRAAFAAVVLGSGLLAYHQHVIARERRELAVDLAKLAAVGSTPSEILTNYAAICLMTAVNERPAAATADTDILRLLQ